MGIRVLNLVRPVLQFLPEVPSLSSRLTLKERAIWTIIVLLIFLVCSQVPLYGIAKMGSDDPLYWTRVILASNRGTLMELGISPIVNAGMIMQLLAGAKIIDVDQSNPEDKQLFAGAQKLLAVLIGFFEAFAYVWSGMYGDLNQIGIFSAIMLVLQLTFASILVQLLDEMLSKGYGIGSAISLFIATNVCEGFLWRAFSPMTVNNEYEGAILALLHSFVRKNNKFLGIQQAFYRDYAPNINNLLATVFIFLVVNYFQGFKVNIAIHNKQVKGHVGSYPIKLFYTSNIPIILQGALISNLFFISRLLYKQFGGFFLVRLLGRWKEASIGGQSYPVSGLIYYISPPSSVTALFTDPIHGIIYIAFILVTCAVFSRTWIEVSGSGPKDVLRSLTEQNVTAIGGTEKLLYTKLKKYIPIAAAFGGVCIGVLTILADFLGAIGSGTGILLACNIVFEIYEEYLKEAQRGEKLF